MLDFWQSAGMPPGKRYRPSWCLPCKDIQSVRAWRKDGIPGAETEASTEHRKVQWFGSLAANLHPTKTALTGLDATSKVAPAKQSQNQAPAACLFFESSTVLYLLVFCDHSRFLYVFVVLQLSQGFVLLESTHSLCDHFDSFYFSMCLLNLPGESQRSSIGEDHQWTYREYSSGVARAFLFLCPARICQLKLALMIWP